MVGLSAKSLLSLYEEGHGRPPLARGLLLLARALPDRNRAELDAVPVGDRDRLLTALRAATFGDQAPVVSTCPACESEVETVLDLRALLVLRSHPAEPTTLLAFDHDGRRLRYRRPNTADLREALAAGSRAELVVAERCLATATATATPDDEIVAAFAAELVASDPWAEVALEFRCPDCDGVWRAIFDVVDYFWREIESAARRTLREVHLLAKAYGWSETEILDLSPLRRQLYLGMVSS